MIVTRKDELAGGGRFADGPGCRSTQMLVQADGAGLLVADTEVGAKAVRTPDYRHHVRANHLVAGKCTVGDRDGRDPPLRAGDDGLSRNA